MRAPKPRNLIRTQLGVCLAAALLLPAASLRAATPAGTAIRNSAAGQYHVGTTAWDMTSNEVVTTVALAPAVRLAPTSASGSAPAGRTYYFAHTVTSDANGADTIDLSASSSEGWPIILYRDADADGVHQSSERTAVTSTGQLAAGGEFQFFVAASVPNGISIGADSTVTVLARSHGGGASQQAQDSLVVSGAGSISGVVNWAGRAPAVGVDVAALDGTKTVASTKTSSSGAFLLTGLPAGSYDVEISGQGMAPQYYDGVAVDGRTTVSCDFTAVPQPAFRRGPADGYRALHLRQRRSGGVTGVARG